MELDAKLKALARNRHAAPHADGQDAALRATRAGQLLTANWKQELVLSGRAYNVTVGGITGGAADTLVTGGGAGTVVDSDQPEMAIGIPSGYYMIPLGFHASARVDLDADGETGSILLFADTTQQIPLPIAASSTVETPSNLLDGGPDSVARAQSAVTADITDPVASIVLAYETIQHASTTAVGEQSTKLSLHYDPSYPTLLKGPCSVIAVWGGTAAVSAIATFDWAEVPVEYFE